MGSMTKLDLDGLLQKRHPQDDFFICDIVNPIPKDDINSMEHPIFSLATKPDQRVLQYANKNVQIEITPSIKGLATIHDKDVLIYCISQIIARKNRGMPVARKIYIQAYDMLVATNRPTGGESYERLIAAMERLSGTRIKTNIETGGENIVAGFGLIESWDIIKRTRDGRMVSMSVVLSEWLYRSILAEDVLTLNKDYFCLRKPIERRIYEIARKHCGRQKTWKISLDLLHKKCGSGDTLRKFRMRIRALEKTNHLPDYNLFLDNDTDQVCFVSDKQAELELRAPLLKLETIEKAKEYAVSLRMDPYALEQEWREWNAGKAQKLTNPDKAFLAFCKNKAKKAA